MTSSACKAPALRIACRILITSRLVALTLLSAPTSSADTGIGAERNRQRLFLIDFDIRVGHHLGANTGAGTADESGLGDQIVRSDDDGQIAVGDTDGCNGYITAGDDSAGTLVDHNLRTPVG